MLPEIPPPNSNRIPDGTAKYADFQYVIAVEGADMK
jgi:hypothetical protein